MRRIQPNRRLKQVYPQTYFHESAMNELYPSPVPPVTPVASHSVTMPTRMSTAAYTPTALPDGVRPQSAR